VAATTSSSSERQHYALQTIFSFFLGLMVLAFVGVGVNTFLPSPTEQHTTEMQNIQLQIEALNVKTNGRTLDTAQQAEMDRLIAQQNALQRTIETEMKGWARTTSIILVVFATIVMAISLLMSDKLRVISNGLLLGGLFTMIYGVGWVIFSGNSVARFAVIAFALAVAIGLGYLKFVRGRAQRLEPVSVAAAGAQIAVDGDALTDLAGRVAALEERSAAAAAALAGAKTEEDQQQLQPPPPSVM
jgi:hypothetical protein